MEGEIELYNISFLILKVELHIKGNLAAREVLKVDKLTTCYSNSLLTL